MRLIGGLLRREASSLALWDIPSFLLSTNGVFIVVMCVCVLRYERVRGAEKEES